MNFKEALIAHLQGEKVEVCDSVIRKWSAFGDTFRNTPLGTFDKPSVGLEFRVAPRTITVNGVEVPAPEDVEPLSGVFVYVADPTSNNYHFCVKWVHGNEQCSTYLKRGLVYLNKEDAIARAKAMLLCK